MENETIETITKAYEEKIAQREKEILKEKEKMKEDFEKEKQKLTQELNEKHNKDIADIITGRKSVEKVQDKEERNDEKSFFDKALDDTRKKLGITKEEK